MVSICQGSENKGWVGWLIGWLVGLSVEWLVGRLVYLLID